MFVCARGSVGACLVCVAACVWCLFAALLLAGVRVCCLCACVGACVRVCVRVVCVRVSPHLIVVDVFVMPLTMHASIMSLGLGLTLLPPLQSVGALQSSLC